MRYTVYKHDATSAIQKKVQVQANVHGADWPTSGAGASSEQKGKTFAQNCMKAVSGLSSWLSQFS